MDVRTDFSELRGRILDLNSALESPGPAPSKYIYFPGMKTKLSVSNLGMEVVAGQNQVLTPHLCTSGHSSFNLSSDLDLNSGIASYDSGEYKTI